MIEGSRETKLVKGFLFGIGVFFLLFAPIAVSHHRWWMLALMLFFGIGCIWMSFLRVETLTKIFRLFPLI